MNNVTGVGSGSWRNVAWAGLLAAALVSCESPSAGSAEDWPIYGGSDASDRYSRLTQITPRNVSNLREVWRFEMPEQGESQTNPLIVGGKLFGYTPDLNVIALDGATGRLLWRFDAGIQGSGPHRGLVWFSDAAGARLLAGVMNFLYALDPETGKPIADFGEQGRIDLRQGLGRDPAKLYVSLTSPGVVYKDLIIVGFRTREVGSAAPGDIRAYDVHTGKLRWSFHTIPHPGEEGHDSWPPDAWQRVGAANSWAGFALDAQRGIVYAPTGSAASDFYGADRSGDNLYANSLLALDASTGRRIWHFQAVHHDIWDRDFSSPPTLLTVTHRGRRIDAVAQATKQGMLYLFDRATGAPIFPIEERAVPPSTVPGENASATQPYATVPVPFARQQLTAAILAKRTPEVESWAKQRFAEMRSAGQFVPLSVGKPTVVFPGFDGGAEWGGAAVDPQRGVIYINSNDVAWTGMLMKNVPGAGLAASLYQSNCAACHGADRSGSPPAFPSLLNLPQRLSQDQVREVIRSGRGRMPPFPYIQGFALDALLRYVQTGRDAAATAKASNAEQPGVNAKREMGASLFAEDLQSAYAFSGYNKFLAPDGYPAVAPPWGTLNAIDLNTGQYLWRIPLGEYPALVAQGTRNTGSENYGGPILTASGLLFIGASLFDHKFRAFDAATGALLWESALPQSGTATPATYRVGGRQYIVILTSNARDRGSRQGSTYVAYALSEK